MKLSKLKKEHLPLMVVVGAIALILIVLVLNFRGGAGGAIYLGAQPSLEGTPEDPINLLTEGKLIFTALPNTEWQAVIKTQLNPIAMDEDDWMILKISLERVSSGTYSLKFSNSRSRSPTTYEEYDQLVAQEVVYPNQENSFDVYLDTEDIYSDLRIKTESGQVSISNIHLISDAAARINLQDGQGRNYPTIINLPANNYFAGVINASSLKVPPAISVEFAEEGFQLADAQDVARERNYSWANFSWSAGDAGSYLLRVLAKVGSRESIRYYSLAVGNKVYSLNGPRIPQYDVTYDNAPEADLKVQFLSTTALQPFSLPCELKTEMKAKDFLRANPKVARIYAYHSEPKLAFRGDELIEGDDWVLKSFDSYFVKLSSAEDLEVNFDCLVKSVLPITQAFTPQLSSPRSKIISRGWSLLSIPGTVPQRLDDYVGEAEYELFECEQNNQCQKIDSNVAVEPGKVYWVNAKTDLTMRYLLE